VDTSMSKTLSYFLRHQPGEAGLSMDDHGYVPAGEMVAVLRENGWDELTEPQLLSMVDEPEVERFERRGSWLRATYGHSVNVELDPAPLDSPGILYHGTSRRAWSSIQVEGLKPQGRQYVHLSKTIEEARRVGHRHDSSPVVLQIVPPDETDHEFYESGPVVLTDCVPPEWIEPVEERS